MKRQIDQRLTFVYLLIYITVPIFIFFYFLHFFALKKKLVQKLPVQNTQTFPIEMKTFLLQTTKYKWSKWSQVITSDPSSHAYRNIISLLYSQLFLCPEWPQVTQVSKFFFQFFFFKFLQSHVGWCSSLHNLSKGMIFLMLILYEIKIKMCDLEFQK